MMNESGEITIARPIEEVFDFVTDFENDPLWCPEAFSAEKESGEKQMVGARYKIVAGPNFMGMTMKQPGGYEVTEVERPRAMEWSFWQGAGTGTSSYSLQSVGEGTLLRYEFHVSLPGMQRLMEPPTRALSQYWRIPRMLKRLKKYLEVTGDEERLSDEATRV